MRPITSADFAWIAALNAINEVETSKIDVAWLEAMSREWFSGSAANERDGYLIVFDQTARYGSPNFKWFADRFARFAYVDRIVVDSRARGQGLARELYAAAFEAARQSGHDRIVCEVNFDPPNPASDAFHAKLGFAEIGRATLANGKTVRYLERRL